VQQKAAYVTDSTVEVSSFSEMCGAAVSHMSTVHKQFKMADVIGTGMKQTVVTEFFTTKKAGPTGIQRRLNSVHRERTTDVSTVRHWVRRFKSCETEIGDKPQSSQPAMAVTVGNKIHTHALIKQDFKQTATMHT
jgi:hypothetical protein